MTTFFFIWSHISCRFSSLFSILHFILYLYIIRAFKEIKLLRNKFSHSFQNKSLFQLFSTIHQNSKKNLTVSHIWFTFLHRRMRSSLLSFTSLQKTRISFSTIFHLLIISLLHNRFFSIMYLKSNTFLSLMAKIF